MTYDIDRLITARIHRGLSQRALAEALGISNQLISLIENGRNKSPKTLKKIADYLQVPMEEVVIQQREQASA
jgi:transcriptional regulator with XRE-family HTH domain